MKRRKHQKFRSRGGIRLPAAITLCLALSLLIFSRAVAQQLTLRVTDNVRAVCLQDLRFRHRPIGAFATVTFYTDRRASTISVPTESILTGNNNEQYVFTVNADGTAATRVTVTTGLVTKDSTEIVSGLKAGDRVVTKGQSYLSDGAAVHVVTSDAADGGEG